MARSLVKVSPKISSHRAGWIALVYSSVRSWRILRSSTRQNVASRLPKRRQARGAAGTSTPWSAPSSAEAAGGAPGPADIAKASLVSLVAVGQLVGGVVAEDVHQAGARAEPGLERRRGVHGAQ